MKILIWQWPSEKPIIECWGSRYYRERKINWKNIFVSRGKPMSKLSRLWLLYWYGYYGYKQTQLLKKIKKARHEVGFLEGTYTYYELKQKDIWNELRD